MTPKNRILKRITAGLLALMLIFTSMQIGIAVTPGNFDPAPYFTDENGTRIDAMEAKSYAEFSDYGDINVLFPVALATKDYKNSIQKTVDYYMITLSSTALTLGNDTFKTVYTKKVLTSSLKVNNKMASATLTKDELSAQGGISEGLKYNISVVAVDSVGWRSEPIDCLVSKAHMYSLDADLSPVSTDYAKEMLRMEGKGTGGTQTDSGIKADSDYKYVGEPNILEFNSPTNDAAKTNGANKSRAYRFWIKNLASSKDKEVSANITYSRQGYNYAGAEEVWFWVDLSDVMFEKLSFQLMYNCKSTSFNKVGGTPVKWGPTDNFSEFKFTTAATVNESGQLVGNKGVNPVYIQSSDGLWQQINMNNGSLENFGHYKGYIRIPISYFCADKTIYYEFNNSNNSGTDGEGNRLATPELAFSAGTPIANAPTAVVRYFYYKHLIQGDFYIRKGYMRPIGGQPTEAIKDMFAAGFTYSGASDDSVRKAFYIDDVLFSGKTPFAVGEFPGSSQTNVSAYYDRAVEIPKFISVYIERYLPQNPTLMDVETVRLIQKMLSTYNVAVTALTGEAQAHLQKAINACQWLLDDQVSAIGSVPVKWFETELEMLPDSINVQSFTEEQKTKVETLKAVYDAFDKGQFELLGEKAKLKFMELYSLIVGATVSVNSAVGENQFILFNDFETNYPLGQKSLELYDDSTYRVTDLFNTDVQHNQNFVTYSSNSDDNINGFYQISTGERTNVNLNGKELLPNRVIGNITTRGFNGSKSATMHIKTPEAFWWYRTMAVTYKGQSAPASSNHSALPVLNINELKRAAPADNSKALSLIFYVDFSGISNFYFSVKIATEAQPAQIAFVPKLSTNIYYVDANGNWAETTAGSNGYAMRSSVFNNYKGFIKIPLQNFVKFDGSNVPLNENDALSQIQQVKFSVWGDNAAEENALVGKNFSFDSIGFTYDKAEYGNARPADKGFDEIYKVKTTNSTAFEQNVNKLDLYGDRTALTNNINTLFNDYNNLSSYQKTLDTVIKALQKLNNVKAMVDGNTIPPTASLSALNAEMAKMPALAKSASFTGANALPYPGYDASGEVNYATFGFTKADTAGRNNIKTAYNEMYKRLSANDRTTFEASASFQELKNAYSAVLRVEFLESIKVESDTYKTDVTTLYAKNSNNLSIMNNAEAQTVIDSYNKYSFFAKDKIRKDLSMKDMPLALSSVITNSTTITPIGTTAIDGAINKKIIEFNNVIADVKAKVAAKTKLDQATINSIESCLGEYEQYIERYQKIVELKNKYEELSALLPYGSPIVPAEIKIDENLSATVNIDTYVAARQSQMVVFVMRSDFTMTQLSGVSNPAKPTIQYKAIKGGVELSSGAIISELPNSGTSANTPVSLDFTVNAADVKDLDLSAVYGGKITIDCYDKSSYSLNPSTAKLITTTEVPVKFAYSTNNTYSVSIPAETTVVFGTVDTVATPIEVTANLTSLKKLKLSCAKPDPISDFRVMKYERAGADGITPELKFTPKSGTAVFNEFTAINNVGKTTIPFGINITREEWNKAYAGNYSGNLTFEVSLTSQ